MGVSKPPPHRGRYWHAYCGSFLLGCGCPIFCQLIPAHQACRSVAGTRTSTFQPALASLSRSTSSAVAPAVGCTTSNHPQVRSSSMRRGRRCLYGGSAPHPSPSFTGVGPGPGTTVPPAARGFLGGLLHTARYPANPHQLRAILQGGGLPPAIRNVQNVLVGLTLRSAQVQAGHVRRTPPQNSSAGAWMGHVNDGLHGMGPTFPLSFLLKPLTAVPQEQKTKHYLEKKKWSTNV